MAAEVCDLWLQALYLVFTRTITSSFVGDFYLNLLLLLKEEFNLGFGDQQWEGVFFFFPNTFQKKTCLKKI